MPKEPKYIGMTAIIAREWATTGNVPENVGSECGDRSLNIAASEGVVAASDQFGIGVSRRGGIDAEFVHDASPPDRASLGDHHDRRNAGASLAGGHPRFFLPQHFIEFGARGDAELAIGTGEVAFDRLDRKVQFLRDLAIRAAVASQRDNAHFARRQRLDSNGPIAARASAGDLQFLSGACRQWPGTAPRGSIQALGQGSARLARASRTAQSPTPFDQRPRPFQRRRGVAQDLYGFRQCPETLLPAARQPSDPKRDAISAPASKAARIGKLGFRKLTSSARLAKDKQSLRRARPRMDV